MNDSRQTADVVVAGAGLIGLACAIAAAERGLSVLLIGEAVAGESSAAGAGLLAPSIEREEGHASDFGTAARDRYPAYVEWLRARTGIDVPLNRDGIIQLAVNEAGVRGLQRGMPSDAHWLDARELTNLEPALSHGLGGVLHPDDGWVDNVRLLEALRTVAKANARITHVTDLVSAIDFSHGTRATTRSGRTFSAEHVVLAAGAWSAGIGGLPRRIPVEPVRGQMISYAGSPLRRAVYGPTGYMVPRTDGRTLVGATAERVGFDPAVTDDGIARLTRTAAEIIPRFASVAHLHAWAGLRPLSSDLQPILGRDPDEPRLLYATGHSRNGILMTPLTGDCIAALLTDEPTPAPISPFSISRFGMPTASGSIGKPSTVR
jgi:glycine oxidase